MFADPAILGDAKTGLAHTRIEAEVAHQLLWFAEPPDVPVGGDDTARDDGVDAGDRLKPRDLHITNRFPEMSRSRSVRSSARRSISRKWRAIAARSSSGSTCQSSHPLLLKRSGAGGDATPTDTRSRRNRAGRRGGQLLTRARSSSKYIGLPALGVLPVPLSRMVAPYAENRSSPAGDQMAPL